MTDSQSSGDAPRFTTISATVDGAIGRLTLERPEKLNPLGVETLEELAEAARWFDRHPELKVVVVSGAGRAFSAGADIGSFGGDGARGIDRRSGTDAGRRMAEALESMDAISIAAIRGWCVGGGLVLAAACDLRVASDNARFSIPEVDLGLPLAWGGIPRLVREIGPAITKELVLTCRPFGADEARQLNFLNRVVPDDQLEATADELATTLAAKSDFAIKATKRHVNAVTEQMVGTMRSWSDADGLIVGLADPEGEKLRQEYLTRRANKD
ncbi:MAG: enoyl-CoA hydratase/isomerase family protein [Acidimicrobiales bacterium]